MTVKVSVALTKGVHMKKAEMDYDVYCGVDVGKRSNYVVALDPVSEKRILGRVVPQDESEIRKVLTELSLVGKMLITVDQTGNIGRLVIAVAQDMNLDVAHISPRRFKKVAETYSESKTDALDAYIIADISRTIPRHIDMVATRDRAIEEVKVLSSCRSYLVQERTSAYNRLHDFLQQISPPLEVLFRGDKLHGELALSLFAQYGGPCGLKRSGFKRVSKWASSIKWQKSRGVEKVVEVFEALATMTVVLPTTELIEKRIKILAKRIRELNTEIAEVDKDIEALAPLIPEVDILKSIPGIGKVFSAVIITEIGDISRFPSANHLASYASVVPKKKESGTTVNSSSAAKGGNRRLKNAFIESARLAAQSNPHCKTYYDKKCSEGKTHIQALRSLARGRAKLIYALLSTGSPYEPLEQAA